MRFIHRTLIVIMAVSAMMTFCLQAQGQRSQTRLTTWKFHLGNAADPQRDFGCGTEYFNYLTKANSIHNEGPYSMKFDDSSWQEVSVPHDWATELPYDSLASHSHGYKTVGWRYPETSVGWYRKMVHIDESELGKHLQLRFDGIFRNATVWFNGFYMGTEPSGYASQVYDVTEYVNYGGDNLICVRADASLEEGWYYEGAGIYRDAWLETMSPLHVAPWGTFVYAEMEAPYSAAQIHIETDIDNQSLAGAVCQIDQRLFDADGREICSATPVSMQVSAKGSSHCAQVMTAEQPHLWSPATPYLYYVETTVRMDGNIVDTYKTTTGVRHIAFDADRGFLLNGSPLKLKGVNMHQDHAGVGTALPEALMEWRVKRLKELGCNAYRSSHNPMTPALLDICDREGILVINENRLTGVNREHRRLLENMIRRDRNHPCIILWSDGNEEWGLENTVQGIRIAETMRTVTRLLDPTRPSTIANAGGSELIKGLDVVGYNYIIQNDVENRRRLHPEWKIVGTEETTGCGTRGIYFDDPQQPGRMTAINRSNAPGVENVIERGWQFYADHEWASGLFYWTGFDYRGEPNPLKYPATDSEFGILDYCGFWKDEAWYLRSWWTDKPTLHIFPHWNLRGHEGEPVELWAYSNCDEVELTVNGKRLERKAMPRNGHLKWDTVYQPGKIVATGYKNGHKVLTETIETTKPASLIQLSADRTTIAADGRDLSVITICVTDHKRRMVPDACPMLTLSLKGAGTILGAGNGDPSYLGADHPAQPCREFQIPAFNGLAQVLIQSGTESEKLKFTVSADGLKEGSIEIFTR